MDVTAILHTNPGSLDHGTVGEEQVKGRSKQWQTTVAMEQSENKRVCGSTQGADVPLVLKYFNI